MNFSAYVKKVTQACGWPGGILAHENRRGAQGLHAARRNLRMNSVPSEIANVDLIVRGKLRPSSSGQRWCITSPATGDVVGSVASATREDLIEAIESAHEAFLSWSKLTPYQREKIIRQAAAHVRSKAEEIGRLMAIEQGKPFNQSKSEITASCDTLDYYAAEGVRLEGSVLATEDKSYRSSVIYQPLGVCALITPWNYPVSLLSWKLGPALATGCTVVVKPTPVTPMSPTAFCAALIEGGIPAGVISVLNSESIAIAEELVTHPLVAKVCHDWFDSHRQATDGAGRAVAQARFARTRRSMSRHRVCRCRSGPRREGDFIQGLSQHGPIVQLGEPRLC